MGMRGARLLGATRRSGPAGPVDPHKALTAIGETAFTWDMATDAIAWGPNAAAVLGIPHIGLIETGQALAEAIEPEQGTPRAGTIRAVPGTDDGAGVPYRIRYGLRNKSDRLVMVEETGRWFADAHGRPALAEGVVRVSKMLDGANSVAAGLKARAALLAHIMEMWRKRSVPAMP